MEASKPSVSPSAASSTGEAVACVMAGVIGSMVFPIIPFIVGIVSDRAVFTVQQTGFIGSADMAGMFIAAVFATWWIRRSHWRAMATIASILLLGANLLTMAADDHFLVLAAARVLAGVGGGSLMALGMAGLGYTRNHDRWFGVFVTSQAVLGAFGAWFIPRYVLPHGLAGIVYFLVVFAIVLMLFIPSLPHASGTTRSEQHSTERKPIRLATVSLFGAFVFGGGVFAVWVYLERIGHASGMSAIAIGDALATALLAAIAGSVVSTFIAGRYSRIWPITAVTVAQLVAFVLLLGAVERWEFAAAVMIISFLWYFSVPFQLGITVDVDRTGRFVVLFLMAIKASYAVAPAFAAQFVRGEEYGAVPIIGIVSAILAYLIYCPLALLVPGKPASASAPIIASDIP